MGGVSHPRTRSSGNAPRSARAGAGSAGPDLPDPSDGASERTGAAAEALPDPEAHELAQILDELRQELAETDSEIAVLARQVAKIEERHAHQRTEPPGATRSEGPVRRPHRESVQPERPAPSPPALSDRLMGELADAADDHPTDEAPAAHEAAASIPDETPTAPDPASRSGDASPESAPTARPAADSEPSEPAETTEMAEMAETTSTPPADGPPAAAQPPPTPPPARWTAVETARSWATVRLGATESRTAATRAAPESVGAELDRPDRPSSSARTADDRDRSGPTSDAPRPEAAAQGPLPPPDGVDAADPADATDVAQVAEPAVAAAAADIAPRIGALRRPMPSAAVRVARSQPETVRAVAGPDAPIRDDAPLGWGPDASASIPIGAPDGVSRTPSPMRAAWEQTELRRRLQALGFDSLQAFVAKLVREECLRHEPHPVEILSLGGGALELEIGVASHCLESSVGNFAIRCVDTDLERLTHGGERAARAGVRDHLSLVGRPLASWDLPENFSVCIARGVLHRLPAPETWLDHIRRSIEPDGLFLVHDRLVPDGVAGERAAELADRIRAALPASWPSTGEPGTFDASSRAGRASEASRPPPGHPELGRWLRERFEFESFLAFGGLVDRLLDDPRGPGLDPDRPADRALLARLSEVESAQTDAGLILPSRFLASLRARPVGRTAVHRHWTPEFCFGSAAAAG